jgi:dUTP pyrophosphatase
MNNQETNMSTVRMTLSADPDPELRRILATQPPVPIRFRLVRPNAKAPTYATAGASGMDGYMAAWAHTVDVMPLRMAPGVRALVHLGIAVEIPPGYELQVRPRSGLALRDGVTVLNAPGTIDSDYRGEIGATLVNLGDEPVTLNIGDRVCQLVLAPVVRADMVQVEELGQTERGVGGFGSSGR